MGREGGGGLRTKIYSFFSRFWIKQMEGFRKLLQNWEKFSCAWCLWYLYENNRENPRKITFWNMKYMNETGYWIQVEYFFKVMGITKRSESCHIFDQNIPHNHHHHHNQTSDFSERENPTRWTELIWLLNTIQYNGSNQEASFSLRITPHPPPPFRVIETVETDHIFF